MYAVVRSGGKQVRVTPGEHVRLEANRIGNVSAPALPGRRVAHAVARRLDAGDLSFFRELEPLTTVQRDHRHRPLSESRDWLALEKNAGTGEQCHHFVHVETHTEEPPDDVGRVLFFDILPRTREHDPDPLVGGDHAPARGTERAQKVYA